MFHSTAILETVILRCISCGRALRDSDYHVGHCPCGYNRYRSAKINYRQHKTLIELVYKNGLCEFVNDRREI